MPTLRYENVCRRTRFSIFFIFKYLKKNTTMSLKSEKFVGKVSNSSINTISVSEYSCLHCVSHFTNLVSMHTRDHPLSSL
jgi:hypothetical protein